MVPGKGSSPAPSFWSQVRNSLVEEWQVPEEINTNKEVSFLWMLSSGLAAPSCGSHFGRANVKQLAHPFAAKAVTANLGRGQVSGCFSPTLKKMSKVPKKDQNGLE